MGHVRQVRQRDSQNWYSDGLRFECTQCGECCRRPEGYVWVGADEIRTLAAHLDLNLDAFGLRYLRRIGTRYALLDSVGEDACVFLREGRCQVYAVRPRQCRAFPFWSSHVESPATWARTASQCEGIRPSAALVEADEIDEMLAG